VSATRRYASAVLAVILLPACAPGPDAAPRAGSERAFAPSGFLGDYAQLRSGREGAPRLGYVDSASDFSSYVRVIIEPVMVWRSREDRFAGLVEAQRTRLAEAWEAALREAFAGEFELVDSNADAGTLRLRTALTAAIDAADSDDPGQLRYVEVELELLDASTNRRLAAAVDSKGSADASGPSTVDSKAAFQDWAERASIRVAALRSVDRTYPRSETP
jgi:hypothetical protein